MVMDVDTDLYDVGTLEAAIRRSLTEGKALLCFIGDGSPESTRWEVSLLDNRLRAQLKAQVVALQLTQGSEQANYLNAFCPVSVVPAVVVIENAKVIANLQSGSTSLEQFQGWLDLRYSDSKDGAEIPVHSASKYIDLPPAPSGAMRLPNNAYDAFRSFTDASRTEGYDGKRLLFRQLQRLVTIKDEMVASEARKMLSHLATLENPKLSEDAARRLLNLPASVMKGDASTSTQSPTPSNTRENAVPTHAQATAVEAAQDMTHSEASRPSSTRSSAASQQAEAYRLEQKRREQERRAEQQLIKDKLAADKKAKRELEAQKQAEAAQLEQERRRRELIELRKKNSTTANPSASDIRIQVRLFDGTTIRSSFPHTVTIAREVRQWIDSTRVDRTPFDLKLILTPLPNRTIEAGEEDQTLSDIEGIKGSATLVTVPIQGAVDSYSSSGSGILGTVLGGGYSFVSNATGKLYSGISSLLGTGSSAAPSTVSPEPSRSVGPTEVRVRTLADQRRDEDHTKRRDQQFYAGNGLNVEPPDDDK